jgi:hypothetical protein
MAFAIATKQSNNTPSAAPLLDAGGYAARIAQIIDLGLQPGSAQYPQPAYKMLMKFELLDEFMCEVNEDGSIKMFKNEDGDWEMTPIKDKPRWFDFEFTYNKDGFMGDRSHIYKLMQAVDAFEVVANLEQGIEGHPAKELKELLSEPLTVNLIQQTAKSGKNAGKMVNKISAFAAMKGKDKKVAPPLVNVPLFFDMDAPDVEVFKKLPSGNPYCPQERIKAGPEYGQSKLAALLGESGGIHIQADAPKEAEVTQEEVDAAMEAELARQAAAAQTANAPEQSSVPF